MHTFHQTCVLKKRYSLLLDQITEYELCLYNKEEKDEACKVRGDSLELLILNCHGRMYISSKDAITTISAPVKTSQITMEIPLHYEEILKFNKLYEQSPGFQ